MAKKKSGRRRGQSARYDGHGENDAIGGAFGDSDEESSSDSDGEGDCVFDGHGAPVTHVAFLPCNFLVVTGDEAGVVRVFDRRTERRVVDARTGRRAGMKVPGAVAVAQVEPLGGVVLGTLDVEGGLHVGNYETGEVAFSGRVCERGRVAVLRGLGKRKGAAEAEESSCFVAGTDSGSLLFFRHFDGKKLETFGKLLCHSSMVTSIAVWERTMVTGSEDGTAMVWDWDTKKRLATLSGHDTGVLGVAISQESIVTVSLKHGKACGVQVFESGGRFDRCLEFNLSHDRGLYSPVALRGVVLLTMKKGENMLLMTDIDTGEILKSPVFESEIYDADMSGTGWIAVCGKECQVVKPPRQFVLAATQGVNCHDPFESAFVGASIGEGWEPAVAVSLPLSGPPGSLSAEASLLAKAEPKMKGSIHQAPAFAPLPGGTIPPPGSGPSASADPRHPPNVIAEHNLKKPRLADSGSLDPRRPSSDYPPTVVGWHRPGESVDARPSPGESARQNHRRPDDTYPPGPDAVGWPPLGSAGSLDHRRPHGNHPDVVSDRPHQAGSGSPDHRRHHSSDPRDVQQRPGFAGSAASLDGRRPHNNLSPDADNRPRRGGSGGNLHHWHPSNTHPDIADTPHHRGSGNEDSRLPDNTYRPSEADNRWHHVGDSRRRRDDDTSGRHGNDQYQHRR